MTDIVERLRGSDGFRVDKARGIPYIRADLPLLAEAADEIERMRTALAIKDNHDHFDCAAAMAEKGIEIERLEIENNKLRAALEGNPDWGAAFSPEDIGLVKVNNNSNVNWPWYRYPAPDDAVF